MTDPNTHDLAALFAAEDRRLADDGFRDAVMGRIRRQSRLRRLVIFAAGAAGAAGAAVQLPQLLSGWMGADEVVNSAVVSVRSEVTSFMGDPLVLLVAAAAAVCILAVTQFEQA